MLVSQKKEWYNYEEEVKTVPAASAQKMLNVKLRVKCLLLVVIVACMAMFITVRSEMIVRKGYELVNIKAQAMQLNQQNAEIKLQIASLKSPQRIKQIATAQLGMMMPQNMYCAANTAGDANQYANKTEKSLLDKTLALLNSHKAEASKGR